MLSKKTEYILAAILGVVIACWQYEATWFLISRGLPLVALGLLLGAAFHGIELLVAKTGRKK